VCTIIPIYSPTNKIFRKLNTLSAILVGIKRPLIVTFQTLINKEDVVIEALSIKVWKLSTI